MTVTTDGTFVGAPHGVYHLYDAANDSLSDLNAWALTAGYDPSEHSGDPAYTMVGGVLYLSANLSRPVSDGDYLTIVNRQPSSWSPPDFFWFNAVTPFKP